MKNQFTSDEEAEQASPQRRDAGSACGGFYHAPVITTVAVDFSRPAQVLLQPQARRMIPPTQEGMGGGFEMRVQAIRSRLQTLKDLASQLDKTIADKKVKDYFLRPALNALSDVETYLLPQGLKASNPWRCFHVV